MMAVVLIFEVAKGVIFCYGILLYVILNASIGLS